MDASSAALSSCTIALVDLERGLMAGRGASVIESDRVKILSRSISCAWSSSRTSWSCIIFCVAASVALCRAISSRSRSTSSSSASFIWWASACVCCCLASSSLRASISS
ncbi:hypothetical protein SPRG_21537, partial [Saprolegnia parasitica CBS 223.65]